MIQVDPAKEKRYTVTNGRLMITEPTSTEDDGLYQCRAYNNFGFILSNNAKLSAGCMLALFGRNASRGTMWCNVMSNHVVGNSLCYVMFCNAMFC